MDPQEHDEMLRRIMQLTVTFGRVVEQHEERLAQHEERLARQDAILEELRAAHRTATALWERQEAVNDTLTAAVAELREFNREQKAMNARLETLITHVRRAEGNGRDA
jgi:hypothetical protein